MVFFCHYLFENRIFDVYLIILKEKSMKIMTRLSLLVFLFMIVSCQSNSEKENKDEAKTAEKKEVRRLTEKEQLVKNVMHAHHVAHFQQKKQIEFRLHLTEDIKESIKTKISSESFQPEFQNDSVDAETQLFAQVFALPYALDYDDFELDLIEQKKIENSIHDIFKVVTQREDLPQLKEIQTQSKTNLIKEVTLENDGEDYRFVYEKYISVSGITVPIQIDLYKDDQLVHRLSIQRIKFK